MPSVADLIEVLISPILEACPTDNKESSHEFVTFFTVGDVPVLFCCPHFFFLCLEHRIGRFLP